MKSVQTSWYLGKSWWAGGHLLTSALCLCLVVYLFFFTALLSPCMICCYGLDEIKVDPGDLLIFVDCVSNQGSEVLVKLSQLYNFSLVSISVMISNDTSCHSLYACCSLFVWKPATYGTVIRLPWGKGRLSTNQTSGRPQTIRGELEEEMCVFTAPFGFPASVCLSVHHVSYHSQIFFWWIERVVELSAAPLLVLH